VKLKSKLRMKSFDLNAMGVSEMNEMEMKGTEGGILGLIFVAAVIAFGLFCCANPDRVEVY